MGTTTKMPIELIELDKEARMTIRNAGKAIDEPTYVVHLMAIEAVKTHYRMTGRLARTIYIPKAIEAALTVNLARNYNVHTPIREEGKLYGCKPVWDSDEFRLE